MSYVLRTMFPVRRDRTPDETDIVALKQSLERLGQYEAPNWQKATDYDEGLFKGIEAFQRDRGLKVDGVVNPKGPTAEAIGTELGPKSPLVMEKDPRPVPGIRDPRSFPLSVSAEARSSNQRSVKAIQHTGKYGLLPGLAATAWQKGDAGKAEVIDLFHQLHGADETGARNLEARFLPMIPRDDRGLFRELRARKEGKGTGRGAEMAQAGDGAPGKDPTPDREFLAKTIPPIEKEIRDHEKEIRRLEGRIRTNQFALDSAGFTRKVAQGSRDLSRAQPNTALEKKQSGGITMAPEIELRIPRIFQPKDSGTPSMEDPEIRAKVEKDIATDKGEIKMHEARIVELRKRLEELTGPRP